MLSNKRLVTASAVVFCCNIAVLIVFVRLNDGVRCYATIDEHQEVIAVIPDDFLSFAIDASEIQEYERIDFLNARFQQLAAALAPARFRVGGTMSDRLIFCKDEGQAACRKCLANYTTNPICHKYDTCDESCRKKNLPYFVMTGRKWSDINKFCTKANLKLLFSINVLNRINNEWSSANALQLLNYSKERGFTVDWQLGNEPNSFFHVFNISITPEMLAHDFKKLRKVLDHSGYKKSLLVGPDTTRPQPHRPECLRYMVEFLGNASHTVNVRSWHQYYLNSRKTKIEDFWNPDTFDLLEDQIQKMKNHTKKYNHIPMWLSETSSAYGGGAPGLSNSFSSSPLWIDKLGLAAKNNITAVIRQSIIHENYSLLTEDLEPLPDWWASVLHKKLVGNKVLNVVCQCSRLQRMYAHCTNRKYTDDVTAVTIFAINLELGKAKFLLNGTALHGKDFTIDEYILRAPSNNRRTKTVLLNGWPLYYETSLPDLEPRHIKFGNHITMPPYSIGFWVIKNTSIKVCK